MLKKYPNYWEKRKIDRSKHWWFNVVEEKEEDFEYAMDVAATVSHEQQVFFITVTHTLFQRDLQMYANNMDIFYKISSDFTSYAW